ncbi:metallophosphoesterase family protein [Hymenobacter sp. 5516J-16]|uniref:metallophosphoesterase family protein n=1 Tax=Hymenobacter sp. 5516J-16 TaxID=2932253 RepID=UPI00397C2200
MKKIGLLSDTHSYLDERILHHLQECDEIWHAGDFGTAEVAEALAAVAPLRGVYGNIDGSDVRHTQPWCRISSWKACGCS